MRRSGVGLAVLAPPPLQDQQRSRQLSVRHMETKHRRRCEQARSQKGKDVFQEINKHLLMVFDAATALVDVVTRSKAVTGAALPRANQVTIPNRNQCWASAPRASDLQFFVVASALVISLGLGSFGGWSLYRYFSKPDELSGRAAVSALVERIITVESNGDPNAKNSRSSAMGLGQFLDETWLDLVRAYRPDLTRSRSASETLELRREPKLAREIITRFVARNITMLRQRRLPVTAGTVYLAHFAGGAGAVAILSAPDNFDAALVIVNADSTGRIKRERLIKANPFLEHFTVADLKGWAERKMRGPNLRLAEADTKP